MVSRCEAFEITRERVRERLLSRPYDGVAGGVACGVAGGVAGVVGGRQVANTDRYVPRNPLCHLPEQVVRSLGSTNPASTSTTDPRGFTHREQLIGKFRHLKRSERRLGRYLS